MVQSMFIESNKDFSFNNILDGDSIHQRDSLPTTAVPKPYRKTKLKNSIPILSKTQTYLQDRKTRSQSQPPEKRLKQKFEFLSKKNNVYFGRGNNMNATLA